MRCEIHCPSRGSVMPAVTTVAVSAAVLYVLARELARAVVFLAIAAGVCVVLVVPLVLVMRWARRFSVMTVPTAAVIARQDAIQAAARGRRVPAAVPARVVTRRALPSPRRALPAAPPAGVTVTLSAGDYAERMHHVER